MSDSPESEEQISRVLSQTVPKSVEEYQLRPASSSSWRDLVHKHFVGLLEDVLILARLLLNTLLVSVSFLFVGQIAFWAMVWLGKDLIDKYPYFIYFTDGVNAFSLIGSGIYLVVDGIYSIFLQRKLTRSVEKKVGLE